MCSVVLWGCHNSGHSHGEEEHEHTEEAHHHEGEHHHHEGEAHEHEHEHEHEHAHEHGHSHGHGHGHGHAALTLSGYSDSWEVFTEFAPMVKGEETEILAHITRLADFKPLTEGEVKAVMAIGGHKHSQSATVSATPGIFKFEFDNHVTGDGTLSFIIEGETVSIPVKAFDCDEEAEEYAEECEVKSSNGAAFSKEKSWNVDFATEEARVEPFGQVIKTVAQVQPFQGEESTITALADGIVSISGNALIEGREVRQGEVLCQIKSSGMADNNLAVRYAQAEADYNLAKSQYERKAALAEEKIVSEGELLSAKAAYETAKALYNSLRDNFSTSGQSVKSPIAGAITSVAVSNGQFVQAGQTLAVVSRSSKVQIVAEVQPKYYSQLMNISGATFKVMGSDSVWTLEDLGGKLIGYGKAVSAESPLIPVTFSVANNGGFIQGSFVQTYIKTTSSTSAVTVANGALIEEQGNFFVYRQLTPEFFEKTPVKVGVTDGIRTEIKSGLEGGERIVSKGAMFVKLAQASGALDPHAGHNH